MANGEHLAILKQGVKVWNQWRQEHPTTRPDLSAARLKEANLVWANLSRANLVWANFSRANLIGASLNGANLSEAWLVGADLVGADLSEADLSEADLSEAGLVKANLSGANLTKARLREANLSEADLSRANLTKANLSGAILVGTDLNNTMLNGCRIYGISVWDCRLEGAEQLNLIITLPDQPTITVEDLEVAQFIYLLLNHQKLRNALNAVTERGVLLLGRFGGGGLDVLQAVAGKLREAKYLPIIFDFERPRDHDYTETVKTLFGLSRFIIADLSGPSVPQELYATVPHFATPVIPILEKGSRAYSMFVDLLKYPWVLGPPVEFADVPDLLARVPSEVIIPAEEKHQARQQLLDDLFRPK